MFSQIIREFCPSARCLAHTEFRVSGGCSTKTGFMNAIPYADPDKIGRHETRQPSFRTNLLAKFVVDFVLNEGRRSNKYGLM